MTAQECEAALRKGWEFQDVTPADSLGEESAEKMFASVAQDCAKNQELSRKDYECLVKATSMQEYDGCHAALHVR